MKVLNIFKMNDWKIESFFKFIAFIQITVLLLLGLDVFNLHFPILNGIIILFYLMIIPGMLILRIFRLHNLETIENILYCVGFSIFSLFIIGLIMDLFYPVFGIANPISLWYLLVTIAIFIIFLCIISYIRDKDFVNETFIDLKGFNSPIFLFLFIPLILAIIGAYLMTFYGINLILMFLIVSIIVIFSLVMFDKIPKKFYPFTIFIFSLSLLYHITLISTNIYGNDIQAEYFVAGLVLKYSFWDFNLKFLYNAMLSVSILPPIISIFLKLDLRWVFKVIYPIIFSLVPLGLYSLFKKQMNAKMAFISCFFFVSFFIFYLEISTLARQEIGELFLLILIFIIMNTEINYRKKIVMYSFFLLALAFAHYSLFFFFLVFVILINIVSFLSRKKIFSISKNIPLLSNIYHNFLESMKTKNDLLNFRYILPVMAIALSYYFLVSDSILLYWTYVSIIGVIIGLIGFDLNLQALNIIVAGGETLTHLITKYILLISQLFILIGIIKLFSSSKGTRFNNLFIKLSVIAFLFMLISILIPNVAVILNTSRILQIGLIFLAPFCILGALTIFDKIDVTFFSNKKWVNFASNALLIFFVLFFVFNNGIMDQIPGNLCTSIAFNSTVETNLYNTQEVYGSKWLQNYSKKNPSNLTRYDSVLTDLYRKGVLMSSGINPRIFFYDNKTHVYENVTLFFGTNNIQERSAIFLNYSKIYSKLEYWPFEKTLNDTNKVYDNNGAQIFYIEKYKMVTS